MTSQQDQIKSLIADIERALVSEKPRTPWIRASEVEPQRQALAKAQDYLKSLQETFEAPGGWGPVDPSTGQIAAQKPASGRLGSEDFEGIFGNRAVQTQLSGESASGESASGESVSGESAESVLQALLTEMKFLKSSALEPLRLEMDSLRQERDRLYQEVRALAEQRQTASLEADRPTVDDQQLNQFLQALMERLQANLSTQVTHTLSQLETDHAEAVARLSAGTEPVPSPVTASAQLEEMRQLQSRSDQLLVNIDSTLQRMFETLQRNIDSYQISLNQGIENMQSLGQQGEVIVRSLVDHLTQQLGQSTPPEPAFFPPRSAAPSELAFTAFETDDLVGESASESASEPTGDQAETTTDTVFSLDDILPDLLSDEEPDPAPAEPADTYSSTEEQPEDCIREDGTIDLDLLKLDIDRRDEEAAAPTSPDLATDWITDSPDDRSQPDGPLAATDPAGAGTEEQVMPTADTDYLADLTFEDLTIDPTLDDSQVNPDIDPLSASISPLDEQPDEEPLVETQPDQIDHSAPDSLADAFEVDDDDTDLARILPDLGASMSESESGLPESDLEPETDPAIESALDIEFDRNLDLDPATDEIEPAKATLTEQPESSLVPDIPDTDDDDFTVGLEQPDDREDPLSAELVAELEAANQAAEQTAVETVDGDLNALTSDLEEAVVFEAAAPPPETLSPASLPLESALIPDLPEGEAADFPEADDRPPAEAETAADEPGDEWEPDEWEAGDDSQASLPQVVAVDDGPSAVPAVAATTDESVGLDKFLLPMDAPPLPEPPLATEATDGTSADQSVIDPFVGADLSPDQPVDEEDDDPTDGQPADWFLGIDIGTTGLSAVLMNQRGDQVYPLCWNMLGDDQSDRFRLPAVAQIDDQTSLPLGTVGPAALQKSTPLLRNIKPLVKIGIPHGIAGEPLVQWSDQVALPLMSVSNGLADLLKTLSPDHLSCRAVGLRDSALRRALRDLRGVIVGYPNNWPDTYSFNIREAVLAAGLVEQAEQIFFVEEAIAVLLSALPDPEEADDLPEDQQPGLYNCNWAGGTVVISAGATLTEAAMVNLPADLAQLSYKDFALRSFTYAGDGLDQDIVCQLLHVPVQAHMKPQPADPEDTAADTWQALGLHRLELPQPGEADRIKRHRLQQRLNDSPLGRQALAAARRIKLALQEENQFELALADQSWVIKRKDLETKVFLPYVQRINRQINGLLSQKSLSTQAVKQVICTGGSASLSAIARWLRQKFPNATIIQDTYSGEYSNSCSRVAYGLANLCHYPQVLDTHRHQYSDYFLLLELLRILPEQPLPAGGIMHLLEQRGINTQVCQSHILALIEGHLPPGLVPIEGDRPLISAQSSEIDTYRMLAELPLFKKQGGQIYIADPQQGDRLRTHLEAVLINKAQALQEPLTAQLAPETVLSAD